jgi:phosphoribosylaminoimidazolecarboxamide formyltransferase/IMP cyclohydrolase
VRALISVSDKTGLGPLGAYLAAEGYEIVASGGTAAALRQDGVPVTDLEALTGFSELLCGRVKTLHPAVHAGLLARPGEADAAALAAVGYAPIDVLVVNLYPFRSAWQTGAAVDALVEQIDIGGVALLRAGAKNFERVTVLSDPAQYDEFMARGPAGRNRTYRLGLAAYAFRLVAAYDADIAAVTSAWAGDAWPERLTLTGDQVGALRYGENPHQRGAVYRGPGGGGLFGATVHQGKPLSYNNWADADAAWRLAWDLPGPGAVAFKHQMPCGVALGTPAAEAFRRVRDADPVSIFGGIVAFNQPVDAPAAEALTALFLEVVVAPAFTPEALAILARKPALRVLAAGAPERSDRPALVVHSITGGWLVQEEDRRERRIETFSHRAGPAAVLARHRADAELAWRVAQHARSNAVVLVRDGMTVGIGQGQTNRIDAVRHALAMAGERARGAVLASDAFFFPDTVVAIAPAGVVLAMSPGGSVRDREVEAAADAAGVSLYFTGERHFRH